MKKFLFTLLVVLLSCNGFSQAIKKGEVMMNPSLNNVGLNVLSFKSGSHKQNVFRMGLQNAVGYAVIDNLVVSGGVGFQAFALDGLSGGGFDLAGGVRYYFYDKLFGYTNLGFAWGKMKERGDGLSLDFEDDDDEEDWGDDEDFSLGTMGKFHSLDLQIGLGYDFFIGKRFAFEPSISYNIGLTTKVADNKVNMGLFSINLGFVYVFGKDKPAPKKAAAPTKKPAPKPAAKPVKK